MSSPRAIDDVANYVADDDTGFDGEGYCLTVGSDGPNTVTKATSDDTFLGVNHHSTYNEDDTVVRTGEPVAVHQAGIVNVLAKEGTDYTLGTEVSLSDVAGVVDAVADTGTSGTPDDIVGTVVKANDLSGASGPALVQVSITGRV